MDLNHRGSSMTQKIRSSIHSLIATGSICALAVGCGGLGLGLDSDTSPKEDKEKFRPDPAKTTNVGIGVQSESSLFQLAAPTTDDFVIQITACASGYTTTVTSTTGSPESDVPLYTGDGNCVAGLQSFTWSGVNYVKTGGGTLTTGGSLFDDGGTNELYVRLGTQLDATIAPGSEAIFLISEVEGGADYNISGYSTSAGLTVTAIEAPELEIPANGITLSSINATTGVATFAIRVQCINTLSPGATTCQTAGGEDQAFTNMRAKLVTDAYAGVLAYTDASSIMASGTTAITAPDLSTSSPITTEGFSLSLNGAGQLYSNRNMLLVIEYTDPVSSGTSYRYFNVDIGDPQ
jgi:hypothetical protein